VGTFYRFSLGGSMISGLKMDADEAGQVCSLQSDSNGGEEAE
jgi:hypothetical protein